MYYTKKQKNLFKLILLKFFPPMFTICLKAFGQKYLMSRAIGKTPFKWEKGVGIRVVLDPRAACQV